MKSTAPLFQAAADAHEVPAQAQEWRCAARAQGTAGGNDPANCDWPECGCDPATPRTPPPASSAEYGEEQKIA